MSGANIPVPNTKNTAGGIVDLGAAQDGARTFSIASPNGTVGDQVLILGGNKSDLSDAFTVGVLNTTQPLIAGESQNPPLESDRVFRYAQAVRAAVANASLPAVTVEAGIAQPSGDTGAPAVLVGGQVGPITAGTTNASAFSLFADDLTWATSDGAGNSKFGVASIDLSSSATTVQCGSGALALIFGAGGQAHIGSAGAAFSNTAESVQVKSAAGGSLVMAAGSGGIVLDAAGSVQVANTNATSLNLGNLTGAMMTVMQGGTGGIQISIPSAANAGIQLQGGTGASSWTIGAGGSLSLGSTTGAAALTLQSGTGNLTALMGATGNLAIGAAGSFGGGQRVIFIANDVADPAGNPVGGGILYVKAGALTYKGSGGTTTTLGAA